jgi:hypothetical protein
MLEIFSAYWVNLQKSFVTLVAQRLEQWGHCTTIGFVPMSFSENKAQISIANTVVIFWRSRCLDRTTDIDGVIYSFGKSFLMSLCLATVQYLNTG